MARTVSVKLAADVADFKAKLRDAGSSVRQFHGELDKAAKAGKLDAVADQSARMGVVMVGAFAGITMAAAKFDQQMSAVSAATHASARDIGLLRQAALQAGKDTQYSATEAAQGVEELAKAGVSTSAILSGGLKGALSLAAAGGLGVAEAAETAASAMTQFKLSGSAVPHIADLLAAGAGKAQGSVHDMGYALSQSGLVAHQFGLSVEDTTGTLAAFANAGLIGSDAGTSLKTMLIALAKPSDQTAKSMKDLGIHAYDAQGKFVGVTKLAGELQSKLGGLSQEQRNAALAQIFGNDAIRAASVLYDQGATGIQGWINKVNDAGYAADTAAKRTNNLMGDVERLKGSLETMAIESGSGANAGLRTLTKSADALVQQFSGLPTAVGGTITVLAGVGGAALLAGAAWIKMRKATNEALDEMRKTGPVGAKVAEGLETTRKAALRSAAAFVAVEAGAAALNALGPGATNVDRLADSLTNLANSGNSAGELNNVFGTNFKNLDRIATAADAANHGFWKFFDGAVTGIPVVGDLTGAIFHLGQQISTGTDFAAAKEQMTGLDQAFVKSIETTHDAGKANALWQQALTSSKLSTTQLAALLPNTYKAVGQLNTEAMRSAPALGGAAKASNKAAHAVGAVGLSAEDAKKKIEEFSNALRAQIDPVFGLLNAQRQYKKAQEAASAAVAKHGRNSIEAKLATEELAQAAVDVGIKATELGTTFDGKLTPSLRATFKAAGLTKQQIAAVEERFKTAKKAGDNFSGKYAAEVSVTGDKPASTKLRALLLMQAALRKGVPLSSSAAGALAGDAKAARDRGLFDVGGWTGPGSKYQPAGIVHADEFVIKKSSRQKIEERHPGMLDHMNATGDVPGYASGGMVWPFPVTAAKTRIPPKQSVESMVGGSVTVGGSLGAWMKQALSLLGLPASWMGPLHTLIMRESGGNPQAINRWDINAQHGDPSRGLMQTIGGTFNAYRLPSLSGNIYDPVSNIVAGLRYIQSRYGSIFNVQQANASLPPQGYANGGVIPEPVFGVGKSGRTYTFGERGPETVIPGYASGGYVNVAPSASGSSSRGSHLDFVDSYISARGAVSSLSAALKENGRSFSYATQKGRDNRQSLISGIRAAQDAAKAKFEETGSVRAANAVYDAQVARLRGVLAQYKVNAATRRALLRELGSRPTYDTGTRAPANSSLAVQQIQDQMSAAEGLGTLRTAFAWTKPTFNIGTPAGRSEMQTLLSFLGQAQASAQSTFARTGNAKTATASYNWYLGKVWAVLRAAGMKPADITRLFSTYGRISLTPNAMGGVYEPAASGALSDAMIAPGGPTRYAWAEASTGGEAFIPRNGNKARSREIWRYVGANWLGASPGGAAKTVVVEATIPIQLGSDTITRRVRLEVDTALGQLADAQVYATAG